MVIDILLIVVLSTVLFVWFFIARVLPTFRDAIVDKSQRRRLTRWWHRQALTTPEKHLPETEGPDAVTEKEEYWGAAASEQAAREHQRLAARQNAEFERRIGRGA